MILGSGTHKIEFKMIKQLKWSLWFVQDNYISGYQMNQRMQMTIKDHAYSYT